MKAIEQLLRQRIGLDPASVGSALIERTVRLRMKARQIQQPAAYLACLQSSAAEWRELVEAVVVTETWFFRDEEPFVAFARLVRDEWLPIPSARPLRILSVPCSSGEEPYSLVMTLLDAGLTPPRFQVKAVDLSERALARARAGVYGKNSFRGRALEFRRRYFQETKAGYELHREVCDCVEFQRANLLEDTFPTSPAPYDFIFCRNLLIYFDRATQGRVLRKLHALLAPRGVLFVGPAELPLVSGHGFAPANLPLAFAARKTAAESPVILPAARSKAAPPAVPVEAESPVARDRRVVVSRAPDAAAPSAGQERVRDGLDLSAARALADAGQLREAAVLCEAHLVAHGPSAQTFYLLGLITEAAGTAAPPPAAHLASQSALDYYRKALYLEPDHYESLLQLALLLEKQGDLAGASTYRRRLRRLETSRSRAAAAEAVQSEQLTAAERRGRVRRAERAPANETES